MKVLLYTIEMVKGVERLMPWRTLIEVAKLASMEIEIAICSAQVPEEVREYEGVKIYSIDYGIVASGSLLLMEDGMWFTIPLHTVKV